MKWSACFVLSCVAPVLAAAGTGVSFPDLSVASSSKVDYVCKGDQHVTVSYINATNGDSFAYLAVDGTPHVFFGVTSGSGARYASGRYIWWSKGRTGFLALDGDGNAPPLLADCAESVPRS